MKRTSLLLAIGLLAVSAKAFASEGVDPIQKALDEPAQDYLVETFSQDLALQPLLDRSSQGYKMAALDEFLPDRSENSGVLEEVTSLAKNTIKGTYKAISKPTVLLFDGIKTVIDRIPGTGSDSKSEKVEIVDKVGVPPLDLRVGDEDRYTFFEREFAKQLASHRTAQDYNDPAQEELRGKKVLKMLIMMKDFGSDK